MLNLMTLDWIFAERYTCLNEELDLGQDIAELFRSHFGALTIIEWNEPFFFKVSSHILCFRCHMGVKHL